jgi:hypothetical protein
METLTLIVGVLALPALVIYSIWSTVSNRKPNSKPVVIQPGESFDKVTVADLVLTVPHGEASVTDKGRAGLYKIDITYPGKDVLIIAAWPRGDHEGNLDQAVVTEKDVYKSVGSTLVGEDSITPRAIILSFSNKAGGLEYSLVCFIPTSTGGTELLLELTQTHDLNKNTLLEILETAQTAPINTSVK